MGGRIATVRNLAVVALVVIVVGTALWQAGRLRADVSRSRSGHADTGVGLTLYPGRKGIPLPDLQGRTIDGNELSVRGLRGHVVVLNVWGSWCGPCRAEAPSLAAISHEVARRGVRFVGVDVRDNPAAGRAFERSFGITYPSFDDQNGLILAQFTGIIPVSAVPSTVVTDRHGLIRARVVGRVDPTTLRGVIRDTERIR